MDEQFAEQLGEVARNVLVVDDEPIILKALDKFLSRFHYKIFMASHAVDALKILRDTQVGVVITDYQMPMLSGLEFLQQVKKIQPLATRILITAIQDYDTVIQAINDGEIFRFISKPWKGEELIATVHNAAQKFDLSWKNHQLQRATQETNEQLQVQLKVVKDQKSALETLNHSLLESVDNSIQLAHKVLETFHPRLGIRSRKIQTLSLAIARELNAPPDAMRHVQIASLLNEIGLISLPKEIIEKWESGSTPLNQDETRAFQYHPIIGEELTRFIDSSGIIPSIIRCQGEHFDGSGYPDGKTGEFIPLPARIIAVASWIVRSKNNIQTTLEVVSRSAGKRFDPEIVRATLRAVQSAAPVAHATRRSVLIGELAPGMILADAVITTDGTLLLPEGEKLSPSTIQLMMNHDRLNTIQGSITVLTS